MKELAKELVDAYGWRPSVIRENPPEPPAPEEGGPPMGLPPEAPVNGAAPGGISPDILASLAKSIPGLS